MKTERFDEGLVLRQIRQLAPELAEDARRYLGLLPPNWHLGIPQASRDHHGHILKGVVAHAMRISSTRPSTTRPGRLVPWSVTSAT